MFRLLANLYIHFVGGFTSRVWKGTQMSEGKRFLQINTKFNLVWNFEVETYMFATGSETYRLIFQIGVYINYSLLTLCALELC